MWMGGGFCKNAWGKEGEDGRMQGGEKRGRGGMEGVRGGVGEE